MVKYQSTIGIVMSIMTAILVSCARDGKSLDVEWHAPASLSQIEGKYSICDGFTGCHLEIIDIGNNRIIGHVQEYGCLDTAEKVEIFGTYDHGFVMLDKGITINRRAIERGNPINRLWPYSTNHGTVISVFMKVNRFVIDSDTDFVKNDANMAPISK